ncbi:unnamed protein product [Scytosiphon promiscuus]
MAYVACDGYVLRWCSSRCCQLTVSLPLASFCLPLILGGQASPFPYGKMPAKTTEAVTKQPQEKLDYPPPPGAPPGGEWEREPYCGKNSWLVAIFLHCIGGWCVVYCPIDTRRVYITENKKYSKTGAIQFDSTVYDDDY